MRLFEVIQLVEYNTQATLNKWGERIAQAATFNETHLGDEWFYREIEYPDVGEINDEADLAKAVLSTLEEMDPTKNKQYVMTLVRWYIGVIKADKKLQAQWDYLRKEIEYEGYPEDYKELQHADAVEDYDEFDNFTPNAENLNTFKLEDADQIRTALENFERIKPQLQPNERDIGRFKSFYRFEDFVDDKMDPERKQNMQKELLDRSDVKVLYNGPMGTVAIPYSKDASCELGKGTKWCTAGRTNNLFDYYSKKGELLIYNEKPGNEKYQIHVTLTGIEMKDSRDRDVKLTKRKEFEQTHPVLSKLIQEQRNKIIIQLRDAPFDPMEYQNWMGQIDTIIDFNAKHHGKPLRFIDEFWTEPDTSAGGLSPYIQKGNIPKQTLNQLMKYAVSRNQRWPEIEAMFMQMFNNAFGPESDNWNKHKPQMIMTSLDRMLTQLKPYIDKYGWPELEQYKSQLLAKIQKPVQEAPQGSDYGYEGKPEWYDRAVQMKRENPRITATEIARQVGTTPHRVIYWLTGKGSPYYLKRPKDSFPFKPGDFPQGTTKKYVDGAKPEWYDQALQMAKAGGKFNAIAKKFGVDPKLIGDWLVKGRRWGKTSKLINPDAELVPRRIGGPKLDPQLKADVENLIKDPKLNDADIIELIADAYGTTEANLVKDILPTLRQKQNPRPQVIDKTRSKRDPDITGLVQ